MRWLDTLRSDPTLWTDFLSWIDAKIDSADRLNTVTTETFNERKGELNALRKLRNEIVGPEREEAERARHRQTAR